MSSLAPGIFTESFLKRNPEMQSDDIFSGHAFPERKNLSNSIESRSSVHHHMGWKRGKDPLFSSRRFAGRPTEFARELYTGNPYNHDPCHVQCDGRNVWHVYLSICIYYSAHTTLPSSLRDVQNAGKNCTALHTLMLLAVDHYNSLFGFFSSQRKFLCFVPHGLPNREQFDTQKGNDVSLLLSKSYRPTEMAIQWAFI